MARPGVLACGIAFLSGCAALLFETLWFHAASIAFGNGVWASSLVLSSFMAGLALGSFGAAHLGGRISRPLRAYAALELAIAFGGASLAIGLASLSEVLAPLWAALRDDPLTLNATRFALGFASMMIPATAMGATLPVLVKALARGDASFGRVLGLLYGSNTLGAVCGAVLGAAWLIAWLGAHGTACVAAGLDVLAALLAARLASSAKAPGPTPARVGPPAAAARVARILAAALLCGAASLALEVVWFRFLSIFVYQTGLVFALMLAVVLAGIALGGLAAGRGGTLLARPGSWLAALLALTGAAALGSYRIFALWFDPSRMYGGAGTILALSAVLTLPAAFLSGSAFVALGAAAQRELAEPARATGLVALANTVGAALGSLLGGFVLLPWLGIERSLVALGLAYGVAALVVWSRGVHEEARGGPLVAAVAAATLALLAATFPIGLLRSTFLRYPTLLFQDPEAEVVAVRETRLQTLMYMRTSFFGRPYHYQLFTDGLSMSGTNGYARRYMEEFVYLPAALHPKPESALLISFGVGSTARALVDLRSLRRIDVVDVSADILEMSRLVFGPGERYPLTDPRVHVHVEDGRLFLATTPERFDLITGEPPPPKQPGIVNLYTREYFRLMWSRLRDGGFATYWLPVHNLSETDAKGIVRAFCEVFEDCTLWTGAGLDWILLGSRNAGGANGEGFQRLWSDPVLAPDLASLGFEAPQLLGTTFLADARKLHALTGDTPPVLDAWPARISSQRVFPADSLRVPLYRDLMDVASARREFEESPFIARHWPPDLRDSTRAAFRWQEAVNATFVKDPADGWPVAGLRDLHEALQTTNLHTLPLWLLGSDPFKARIVASLGAREARSPRGLYERGVVALAERRYAEAAWLFEQVRASAPDRPPLVALDYEIFALCMEGRTDAATRVAREVVRRNPAERGNDTRWRFMAEAFGLPDPRG
jgi:predicted membrane-bound spermidine synthase